ncbi:MAG TPA: BON domain-containing protein [Flavisolibacter sp.]|nr:BON domain-containing protein [Flavisolibacter sp.]
MKSDVQLQKEVQDEICSSNEIPGAQVGVTTKNGIVTLTGVVDNSSKKILSEKAAQRVPGVLAVAQEMEVNAAISKENSDSALALLIAVTLKENEQLHLCKIQIIVENGWVTLSGEVDTYLQSKTARNTVEFMGGVKGISNNITINAKTEKPKGKEAVVSDLDSNRFIDDSMIIVDGEFDNIVLNGTVDSYAQKEQAGMLALSSNGVSNVENNLVVPS